MTPYIVAFVYGTVWICSVVPFARASLDFLAGDDNLEPDDGERLGAMVIGIFVGAFWPIALPAWGMFRLLKGLNLLRSTRELEWERHALERDKDLELERLRRQVREYKIKGGEML